MCHGVEPDLLGVWALLYVHPTPSSPEVNTKPKPGMTLLLGNRKEKLQGAGEESEEGIYGSAGLGGSLVLNSALS